MKIKYTSLLLRKKVILFLALSGVIIYLVVFYQSHREYDEVPVYDQFEPSLHRKPTRLYSPINVTDSKTNFYYFPSDFKRNTKYLESLMEHNGFLAFTLNQDNTEDTTRTSKPATFTCLCGRVSDPCVCCGDLIAFHREPSSLTQDLYKPVILSSDSSLTQPANFCISVTYIPKKKQIKTSAVLKPSNSNNNNSLPNRLLASNQSRHDTISDHKLDGNTLFGPLFIDTKIKPVVCSGSLKSKYFVDLCIHFTTLEYKFDSQSDHKTLFHGCAYVQIVLERMYVIVKYPEFCFDAHRGALADMDKVDSLKDIMPLASKNQNLSNAVNVIKVNSSPTNQTPLSIPLPKPVNNDMSLPDALEVHLGNP